MVQAAAHVSQDNLRKTIEAIMVWMRDSDKRMEKGDHADDRDNQVGR